MKIVFFGNPEFAAHSLQAIIDNGYDVAAVVTGVDKPAGRGHKLLQSDVKKLALSHNITVLQPPSLKNQDFLETLKAIGADLFIVIAFRMLPEAVWSMPPLGTFNLHASLLPRYRGAAPINRAVMNGDTETGVTTFFLKHEIDTGDIIHREKISIGPDEDAGSVHDRLMQLGASMVVKTLADINSGNIKTIPQPDGEFTPAPKIFRNDCEIDWNKPAEHIRNQIRGLSPYPAACTVITDTGGKNIPAKIFTATNAGSCKTGNPGDIHIDGHRMLVKTADDWLEITSLQPAGKRRMEASAFLLGYSPVSAH